MTHYGKAEKKRFVSKYGSKVHTVKETVNVDNCSFNCTDCGGGYRTLCGGVLCEIDGYKLRNVVGANLHCMNCSSVEGNKKRAEAGTSYLAVVDTSGDIVLDVPKEPVPILGGLAHIQQELVNRFGETSAVDLLNGNRVKFYHIKEVTVDPIIKVTKKLVDIKISGRN